MTQIVTKNYKPEITYCPKCNHQLKYCYSISSKTVFFSNGKKVFVRNLGYKCPNCNDDKVYFSQTATKFALKGIKYSMKILLMIYHYKTHNYSREKILYELEERNITISERNIDILYHKVLDLLAQNYDEIREKSYQEMLTNYNSIDLSIDLISYSKKRLVVIRDYYSAKIIGFYIFKSLNEEELIKTLSKYVKKELPIKVIASVRKGEGFIPILRSLAPQNTKFIAYLKI